MAVSLKFLHSIIFCTYVVTLRGEILFSLLTAAPRGVICQGQQQSSTPKIISVLLKDTSAGCLLSWGLEHETWHAKSTC